MRSEGSPIGSTRPILAPRLCSKPNPGVNSPGSATSLTPILHTLTITLGDVTRLPICLLKFSVEGRSHPTSWWPLAVGAPEVVGTRTPYTRHASFKQVWMSNLDLRGYVIWKHDGKWIRCILSIRLPICKLFETLYANFKRNGWFASCLKFQYSIRALMQV